MKLTTKLIGAVAGIAALGAGSANAAGHLEEITVAYFLEWPMPFQYAKVNGTYDEEMGVKVNWVSFDAGTAMSAAMALGDVQIAVSEGVPPFAVPLGTAAHYGFLRQMEHFGVDLASRPKRGRG